MDKMDKNEVMIKYLKQCPNMNRLFFISADIKDGVKRFVPISNDRAVKQYIDGSKLKYYDFAIVEFRGGNTDPLVTDSVALHENVQSYKEMQSLIDWIRTQRKAYNLPDFGGNCKTQDIYSLSDNPTLSGKESEKMFRYMIQIRVEYIEGDD